MYSCIVPRVPGYTVSLTSIKLLLKIIEAQETQPKLPMDAFKDKKKKKTIILGPMMMMVMILVLSCQLVQPSERGMKEYLNNTQVRTSPLVCFFLSITSVSR